MNGPPPAARTLGVATGAMLVLASMIGTGVFTTTGFLVRDLQSLPAVLLAWGVGGLIALFGALAYGELVAALPANGGEYQLLTRIYHPAVGFVAGWVSLVVGFSAPMAASAVAFGEYLHNVVPAVPPLAAALALILTMGVLHAVRLSWGKQVQNAATVLDILLVFAFIVAGVTIADTGRLFAAGQPSTTEAVLSPTFAISLIYVSFAYSGWNAAVYIAGELKSPGRSLPRALLIGTGTATVLYLGLNYVFVISAPAADLSGVIDIGDIAARHLFGDGAALAVSSLVAVGLFTTVSALMMTGPRVYEAMGRDYPLLQVLSTRGREGDRGPVMAVGLQTILAVIMVVSASFDELLTYMGFTLALFAALTILGVFVLRAREPALARPYKTWGHPVTTVCALMLNAWMLSHALWERPAATSAGLVTLAVGLGLYFVVRRKRFSS